MGSEIVKIESRSLSPERFTQLHDQTLRLSFSRLIASYVCLCCCYFISYLDMNATTTALPTISNALSAGTTITWAGTAFLLGQTTFQPLYGRVSDISGRKPVLLISLGCIMVGDLLSGWAQSPVWLYVTRALSGVGAGGISSLVSIIVSDLVSLRERGKYQGFVSIAIGAGAVTGPFIAAGVIARGHDGWRWAFWVPSILAFICMFLLLFLLPLKPVTGGWRSKVRQIDWSGVFLSTIGIVFLLIPISSGGGTWLWMSPLIIALLTLGVISIASFILVEGFRARLPIMPLALFKERSLTIMLFTGALHDYVWQSTQYFVPLFFQEVRGYSPLESAILTLPYVLAQSLAGTISGPLMSRFARFVTSALSFVLDLTFEPSTLGILQCYERAFFFGHVEQAFECYLVEVPILLSMQWYWLSKVQVLAILISLVRAASHVIKSILMLVEGLVAVQALAREEDRAVATSTRNLLRSLGSVFGIAISTAVQRAVIKSYLKISGDTQDHMGTGDVSSLEHSRILDAKMAGFRVVFISLVPLICLCFIGNFWVNDVTLSDDKKDELSPIEDEETPKESE
ncbi:Major facilitator superfamily domain general substrate transporter [Penicillium malachiteum]|uniref:Major facilitator superfamily domain general substrate transporter n=1 Tax=Penicillium malachiteum TaxID=1324776 RepID=UPI002547121E|nr:Major facilitator superfamily domain general substrate transporter [Penicillium malachiteum]KAJ5729472.1 Major facilitator superfamily domain general substrate transporter [Penicillium malachiteum]